MAKATKAAEAQPAPAAAPAARTATKADRQWWFDARGLDDGDASTLDAAYQSGCSVIVLNPEQQDKVMTAKPRVVPAEDIHTVAASLIAMLRRETAGIVVG